LPHSLGFLPHATRNRRDESSVMEKTTRKVGRDQDKDEVEMEKSR
jgi:hypothetical protein